jgi:gliding motility-associated-like protein
MISVNMGGQYILEAIDTINECTNSDTIFVESFIEEPLLEAGLDQNLGCGETATTITATLEGTIGDFIIEWSTNTGNILTDPTELNIDIEGSGSYFIDVLNTLTNCAVSDTVMVFTTEGLAGVDINPIDISCHGENDGQLTIGQILGGTMPYMYSLNDAPYNDEVNITGLTPGNYSLEIVDVNGCSLDTSFVLTEPDELSIDISPDVNITVGETTQLLGTINSPLENVSSIFWTPDGSLSCSDCLDPIAEPTNNTTYTLTVTDLNGCVASATVFVEVEQIGVDIYIPNIFSPNGDRNGNDGFTLYANENVELIERMVIYDRWGELIFAADNIEPNDPSLGWDGNFKGRAVLEGVYVYKFDLLLTDMTRERRSGDITVVR